MFPEQLKKILRLIKRTGDRVVIYDSANPEDTFVVMDFDSYASAQDLSEEPKNINPQPRQSAPSSQISQSNPVLTNLTEEDLTDKINREISVWKNKENTPDVTAEKQPKKAWQIPSTVKEKAQEVE